jgi:hypothetical protein
MGALARAPIRSRGLGWSPRGSTPSTDRRVNSRTQRSVKLWVRSGRGTARTFSLSSWAPIADKPGVMSVAEPADWSPYRGHRFLSEIIAHAVWLYFRFHLSLRDIEDLLAERGVIVSHEAIRQWCTKFGATFAVGLRRRRVRAGDKWHLDEVVLKISGKPTGSGEPLISTESYWTPGPGETRSSRCGAFPAAGA